MITGSAMYQRKTHIYGKYREQSVNQIKVTSVYGMRFFSSKESGLFFAKLLTNNASFD